MGNTVRLWEKLAVPDTASRTVRLRTAFLWDFGNATETMALLHHLIHVSKSPLKKNVFQMGGFWYGYTARAVPYGFVYGQGGVQADHRKQQAGPCRTMQDRTGTSLNALR